MVRTSQLGELLAGAPVTHLVHPQARNEIIRRVDQNCKTLNDPKWSDLRYVFGIKEDCNGKEAIQA
jgi:hypothetical protein